MGYNPSARYEGLSDFKITLLSFLAIVVAFAAFGLLGTFKLVTQHFSAPTIIDEHLLSSLSSQDVPIFKAQIKGDLMIDSTLLENTFDMMGKIDRLTKYFGFLQVGDHFLMIKTPDRIQLDLTEYSGVITHVTDDSQTHNIYKSFIEKDPSVKKMLVPLVLTTDYDVSPWFAGLAIEVGLLLAGMAGLVYVWQRHFDL